MWLLYQPVPATLGRGHWAEALGLRHLRAKPAPQASLLRLRALPSDSYRESLVTSALLGHSSSAKVLQEAGNLFLPPPGKTGSQRSQMRWGSIGNSSFLCSHCKAVSATWTSAILAASAQGTHVTKPSGKQAAKGSSPSTQCHSSTSDLCLPVLWDEFWSYFTCWNCWRNRTKSNININSRFEQQRGILDGGWGISLQDHLYSKEEGDS